jgi:hypothetical protein
MVIAATTPFRNGQDLRPSAAAIAAHLARQDVGCAMHAAARRRCHDTERSPAALRPAKARLARARYVIAIPGTH